MQKVNIKLILWEHNANTQGLYPIYIRITVNRKQKYISTGHFIPKQQWDEKNEQVKPTHKLAHVINPDILNKKTELMRTAVQDQIKGNTVSSQDLQTLAKSKGDLHNIFDFADKHSSNVKNKRADGTVKNYKKHLLKLENYHGSRVLHFEDITPDFLNQYEKYLLKEVGTNYTNKLLVGVRTLFNAARKMGVIDCYPFSKYELPPYVPPVKDYLTLKELASWEEYTDDATDPTLKQTAVYFLLGCYSGLRVSDWLTFDIKKMVHGEKIRVCAKKNKEWVEMPISKPLKRNLSRMANTPLTIVEKTINESLKDIAKALKIKKHITTHTGRHTFAITMCAEQGISSETCAELMGITVATCVANYYKVTSRKIDNETNFAWKGLE